MTNNYWLDFNDLWDFNDPAASEVVFRGLLAEAECEEDASYRLQLKTQIARTYSLRRMFNEAHPSLDEVAAAMAGGDLVELRYLLERGRTFNSDKQPEKAMPLFLQASALGEELGADYFTVDALHMLGIAAPPAARLDWNLQAIARAEQGDARACGWLASLYNNTGWTLFDEGRYAEALDLFQKAVPLREAKGEPEPFRIAKWCVAKALRMLGRVEEALAIQRKLEAEQEDLGGFTLEEIGECLLALGSDAEARSYFDRAYDKLKEIDWVADDSQRMDRLKDLAGR